MFNSYLLIFIFIYYIYIYLLFIFNINFIFYYSTALFRGLTDRPFICSILPRDEIKSEADLEEGLEPMTNPFSKGAPLLFINAALLSVLMSE